MSIKFVESLMLGIQRILLHILYKLMYHQLQKTKLIFIYYIIKIY